MKTIRVLVLLFFFAVFFLKANLVFARSGCCSHHQGVCGCGCCDGTSLSDTCAPYYPECNSNEPVSVQPAAIRPVNTVEPSTPIFVTASLKPMPSPSTSLSPSPSPSPSLIPTNVASPLVSPSPIASLSPELKEETSKEEPNNASSLGGLALLGGLGYWKYQADRKSKKPTV